MGTKFGRAGSFDSAIFHGRVDFGSSCSVGPLSFVGSKFFGKLDLADAHLHHAQFDVDGADQFSSAVDLRGFTYDRIVVDWRKLLASSTPMTGSLTRN